MTRASMAVKRSPERLCPIAGCACLIRPGLLMCRRHWRMVPRVLQAAVNDAWSLFRNARPPTETAERRQGQIALLRSYREIADQAIDTVNAMEAQHAE